MPANFRVSGPRAGLPSSGASRFAAAAIVLAFAALLAGCSPGSGVIARVGDQKITVDDFKEAARNASGRYSAPPESAKVLLLEDLVQRALILQAAKTSPVIVDSLAEKQRKLIADQVLIGALGQKLAPRDVPVSDAEVRKLYSWRDSVTHCMIIYTMEEGSARAALQAVRGGEAFASVADRYNVAGMLPPGGDLGFVTPGGLVDPLDELIRKSREGSTLGPLRGPGQGWFVVRVLERKQSPQPPFESEAPQLRSLLEQRKQRALAMKAFEALRRQYHVATDPRGVEAIFRYYNTPDLVAGMGGQAVPPPPTPEQLATKLGSWNGGAGASGEYTMKQAFEDLDSSRGERPNPSMLPSLEQWIEGRMIEKVALIEAGRRHLDQEPDVARRIRETMNNSLVEAMYRSEVADRALPGEADLRAAFQRNLQFFTRLVSARFQHLTLPDSAMAAGVFAKVHGSGSLRDAVVVSSPGIKVREEVVTFPSQDRAWAMIEGTVKREVPGAYLGPIRIAAGWRILQLVSKDERTPTFEQLPQEVRQGLFEEAARKARDQRLTAFTDSLRRVIPVKIDRRRLARIAWPPPAPTTTTMPSGA